VRRAALLLAGLAGLAGCGEPQRAESDVELRAEVNRQLLEQPVDRPFALRSVVPGNWTELWLFGGYTEAADIEAKVGSAWAGAPDQVAEGEMAVVVLGADDRVRGFIWNAPSRMFLDCLADEGSFVPADRLVRLGPVPGEGARSSVLTRAGGRAQRTCRQTSLAPPSTPGN
jgi:hypothetical protein